MTIVFIEEGDIFNTFVKDQHIQTIAHGCNSVGVMGAGIAKTIRDRFPRTYHEYNRLCIKGEFESKRVYFNVENDFTVFNLFTQRHPGPNAQMELIGKSFDMMLYYMSVLGLTTVVMPAIGCGIGGLSQQSVKKQLVLLYEQRYNDYESLPEVYFIESYKRGRTDVSPYK